jgi:hypothetical protein
VNVAILQCQKYNKNNQNSQFIQVVFVINVARLNILIKIVNNKHTNLQCVFTAHRKVILPDNARRMKKDFTEKEVLVLDVDL